MPDLVGHDARGRHDAGGRHDNDVTLGSDRGSHVRREMPDLVGHDGVVTPDLIGGLPFARRCPVVAGHDAK